MRVELNGIDVRFGDVTVLQAFNASFPSGLLSCLVGPSGSGKTTVLGLVAGLLQPSNGQVLVGNEDVESEWGRPHPEFVAWVPQGGQMLPSRSVQDNAMIGALAEGCSLQEASARAANALCLVALHHRRLVQARTLSGGEVQRLAFARAIATSRPIILADEPTANLDHATAARVIEVLTDIRTTRTLIVATHDDRMRAAASVAVDLQR